MPEPVLLNPTNPAHHDLVQQLIEQQLARKRNPFDNLELLSENIYELDQGGKKVACLLSHSIVQFHTNELTDKARRFAVYEPTAIGAGAFASVYSVNGLLKYQGGRWHYKTERSYVMKRFSSRNQAVKVSELMLEQLMTADDPFLLSKYPVNTVEMGQGEEYFYFQRMQNGTTLQKLIKDEKKFGSILTVRERMALALALVRRLEEVHQRRFKIKGIDLGRLIHRDIKPDNIFIRDDGEVVIGDYGLATSNNMRNPDPSRGTPNYIDPRLLTINPGDNQEADDWFSMAITLCELFGGYFRDLLGDSWDLFHEQNKDIPVRTSLFTGMTDLTDSEKRYISEMLHSKTRYEVSDRRPDLELGNMFENLLMRRDAEEKDAVERFNPEDLMDSASFTETRLLALLKSSLGSIFIGKNKQQLPTLVAALGNSLFYLPETRLRELALQGYDFKQVKLGSLLRTPHALTTSKLSLFLELGAELRLEDVQYWYSGRVEKKFKQRWLEIARLLFAARPLQVDHAVRTVCINPFMKVCYEHFIGNDDFDSAASCRLADRKVQALRLYEDLAALAQVELACLYDSVRTFYQAHLSNDLLKIVKKDLDLCTYIHNFLIEIDEFFALGDLVVDDENMAYQTLFIDACLQQIQGWIDENNPQWRTTSVETLVSRSHEIKAWRQSLRSKLKLEQDLRAFAGLGARQLYEDLLVLVDESYEKRDVEAMILEKDPDKSQFAKGMYCMSTLANIDKVTEVLAEQGFKVDSLRMLINLFKQSTLMWKVSTLDRHYLEALYMNDIFGRLIEISERMVNIRNGGNVAINLAVDDEIARLGGLNFTKDGSDIRDELENSVLYCQLALSIANLVKDYQDYFPSTVSYVQEALLLLLARREYMEIGSDMDSLANFCKSAYHLRFLNQFISTFKQFKDEKKVELRFELLENVLGFMLLIHEDVVLNQWLNSCSSPVRLGNNPYALHQPTPASDNLAGDSEDEQDLSPIPD